MQEKNDNFLTIKQKILYFIKNQGITQAKFFEKFNIAPSNFKGIGLKSEIGTEKIVKILTEFPELSADWLLLGKGEMLRENQKNILEERISKIEKILNL
ncbi:MAG: hypothetical protein LBN95_06075 [Prevotellaceae bacterium]|jgi:hypothetical protein|nr:hypothetical protein [Prevotellaceae bacterium]